MRKVCYFVANSLDGFISRHDGGVDWLFMDQDYGTADFFASVDVAIMGRKTYDKMQELAPGQSFSPHIRSYVFSRTPPTKNPDPFQFVNEPLEPWVANLRKQPGKDIWLVGGGDLVQQFLSASLVDELGLTVHPRLLGSGVPLFPGPYPEMELVLDRHKKYETGLLQVFYSVKH